MYTIAIHEILCILNSTCARAKVLFVIDGFTTAVALVCAQTICPTVSQYA
ncbi:nicotinate-nucleotide--dimethylbenzimidazole phosphoribosyltransferase, partial [Veillonella montpellierensis]